MLMLNGTLCCVHALLSGRLLASCQCIGEPCVQAPLLSLAVLPTPPLSNCMLPPTHVTQARLAALPFVKDVHPERVLTRSLMAASAEAVAAAQHAQFTACGAEGSSDEPCVAKRPGRMQTRPTFSLEDNLEAEDGPAAEQGVSAGAQRVGNDSYAAGTAARRQRRQRVLLQSPESLASILQVGRCMVAVAAAWPPCLPGVLLLLALVQQCNCSIALVCPQLRLPRCASTTCICCAAAF